MPTTRQMRREAKEKDMIMVQFVSPDASCINLTVDPDLVEDNPEAAGQYLVHEFVRLWEDDYERRRRQAMEWMAGHPTKRERGATWLTPNPKTKRQREEEAKQAEAAAG
jgi:hypothetical protein